MLTFLELYQTLLGFVFFKLYTDAGLVYPPPLDAKKDEGAAGINAFALQEEQKVTVKDIPQARAVEIPGKRVSTKDVRQTIRTIAGASDSSPAEVTPVHTNDADDHMVDEEFVLQPSKADTDLPADLPTLHTLAGLPQSSSSTLFASCVFWLSRETSRPIFEFVVRSFGGRIGWPASSGHGSPYEEDDPAITHVIIDRPMVDRPTETEKQRELRGLRKFVQPQWIVDSINAGKLLVEESYLQGKTLPPHLSPFATYDGGYDPTAANVDEDMQDISDDEDEEVDVGEDGDRTAEDAIAANVKTALAEDNPAALRTAELEAEAAGVDFNTFETQVSKLAKKHKPKASTTAVEDNPNKMLMSNKQRKLYERMKHSQSKSNTEVSLLAFCYELCSLFVIISVKSCNSASTSWTRINERLRRNHLFPIFRA
jgi:pescadillo protein